MSRRFPIAAGLTLVLAAACGPAPADPRLLSATDQFASVLRGQGLNISVEGPVPRSTTPYFSPEAIQLAAAISEVHGPARILVFEYERESDAAAEASRVRPDGQPGDTVRITWVATPRFYRHGTLIVLYVGCDGRLLTALQNVAGAPFVTGSTPCVTS